MSKAKRVFPVVVILLAIIIQCYIITNKTQYTDQLVTVTVTMDSSTENLIQLFYVNKPSDGTFTETNSVSALAKAATDQQLQFTIPCGTQSIRLDFGVEQSEVKIKQIKLQYGSQTDYISADDLLQMQQSNAIVSAANDNGTAVIRCQAGDPYIIFGISNHSLSTLVAQEKVHSVLVRKIIYSALLWIVTVLLLWKRLLMEERIVTVLRSHQLIATLAKNDFKTQFAGSYLGIVWAMVQPIVTVLVYWFVFQIGLKNGSVTTGAGVTVPFVLWLIAGLVPWFYHQDAIIGGTSCLLSYSYLVKKVVFNIDILPIVKLISALFVHLFFVVFTLCIYSAYGFFPDLYTIQVIYYTIAMMALTLGVIYLTSAVVVFFRDLSQIINIFLQVLTWMTPIMWNIDVIKIPEILKTILKLNPMYYVVNGYRDALINKVFFWNRIDLTIYYWMFVLVCFGFGTHVFRKLKIHFADVL